MRIRPIAALSALAAGALLLAGCAAGDDTSDDATPAPGADLCDAVAAPGELSDSLEVTGDFGVPGEGTFDTSLTASSLERSVISEGDGAQIADGDYVIFALTGYDTASGDKLGDAGYAAGEIQAATLTGDSPIGQAIGCATVGTRLSIAFPETASAPSQIYILDVLDKPDTAAWGTEQEPVAGMPEVTLDDDGRPEITIPDADAPTDLQIAVLKEGDGDVVSDGDTTLLQYHGVSWNDGEVFDTSWDRQPYAAPGNTYIPGFIQALAGQKVGSQVLVVIPPALAYGEGEINDQDLTGQTLVFVIDILANKAAAAE